MIEVGDTFEVVKVLGSPIPVDVFKDGGCTIRREWIVLLNGTYKSDVFKDKTMFNQQALLLDDIFVKPIGRLKVTKVK